MTKELAAVIILGALVLLTTQSCSKFFFRANYNNANSLMHETKNLQTKPFLKAHIKNGDVCILMDTWKIDTSLHTISGNGTRYDFNRKVLFEGALHIPIDSVAIFETNKKIQPNEEGTIAALAILAALDVGLGIYCATNPKACFGSCPTFYTNENSNFHYADAEGFSNAIAPSMEYFDIDALNNGHTSQNTFSITMKNEALETHCVKDVKLLAYPRKDGERVYHSSSNDFYLCQNIYPLSVAKANEGDVTNLLQRADRQERFSVSDENNLSSKEEIYLDFGNVNDTSNLGLIVNFRQTLMTTYFIYSAMGYMGDKVGDIFAQLERNKEITGKLEGGIKKELGNIDVYGWDEQTRDWIFQGKLYETGPIAINHQFIPLSTIAKSSRLKLKIVLNKGLWRIDYTALTNIKEKVKPLEISPGAILNRGKQDDKALSDINSPNKHLVSMPGSMYKFIFNLPNEYNDYELFLYSKGYYLEWMRDQWIKDKDLLKLKQMVDNPGRYLQEEAKNYKEFESTMEEQFWSSKIDANTFTYHEK
jgi:hypothetical protein